MPELRSRTRGTRYRIPDVTVVLSPPETTYLLEAAFLPIEIMSEHDRTSKTLEKQREYEAAGIPNIWVFGPRLGQMFFYRGGSLLEVSGPAIRTTGSPEIELTRAEILRVE
ncbi:MAG TPA: Uma2 family endonuclease [Bryobacteraceae bacterium]|nr:Uma2 family endonuclease [Bryobacteraceae bacterium]